MILIANNALSGLLLLTTTLLTVVFTYFYFAYKYWEKRRCPFIPPKFPLGNSPSFISKTASFGLESIGYYDEVKKRGYKFAGIYTITRPVLVIIDPDYVKDILSKDFHHFVDRGHYHNEKDDPISAHLFSLDDTKWKNMRSKLTPTFTSGKMKMMFQSIVDISGYMIDAIDKCYVEKKDVDIKEFLARFTTDVIGSCAFGVECNSFKDPDAEFRSMGNNLLPTKGAFSIIKFVVVSKMPQLALKLGFKAISSEVSDFFRNLVAKTVKYREENNFTRPDFIQLLIDLKNKTKDSSNPFTMDQLAAQVFLFFVAGFDTSSTTMTFSIYELCRNPQLQEKLRDEINEVLDKHEGKITYESLSEMTYLQQVIDEALRMYPPVVSITRKCVKDYKMRDTDVVIERGTPVLVPLYSLQRDADYYPNPEKFDPDRFNAENKASRHPYVHLPFGEGPRNCIGLRFGLMQTKIGLISILRKFRLSISPSTKMPLHLNPQTLLLRSIETLYLKVEKI